MATWANTGSSPQMAFVNTQPKTCTNCSLHVSARFNCVPSRGADHPHLLLVGEAPGKEEDQTGQPFVGRSGKLLDQILASADISPDACRWTNTVRCIPMVDGKIKSPTPKQRNVCVESWLLWEIAQQQPALIVALGKTASVALTGNRSAIDRMRGFQHSFRFPADFIAKAEREYNLVLYEGIPDKTGGIPPQSYNRKTCRSIEYPVVVTYHPAAALLKKSQNLSGLIASDLVYARKIVYQEPRLPGTDYRVVQSVDELNQWSDFLLDYYKSGQTPWLSLDVETGGPDDKAGLREFDPLTEIVSIQVTWKEKHAILIPVSHPEGNFANAFGIAAIKNFLQRLFYDEAVPVIGTNIPFDYKQIYAKFGVRLRTISFDAKFAHQCRYAGDEPNDLDYLSAKYCGMQGYGDGLKSNMAKLPGGKKSFQNLTLDQAFIDYSCGDTDAVYRLAPILIDELKQHGLWETYQTCFLQPLIPIAEMQINGLPIDQEVYEWLKYEMPLTLKDLMCPIRESRFYPQFLQERGCPPQYVSSLVKGTAPQNVTDKYAFNPGSSKQKAKLLFGILGLPQNPERVSKKTGEPSTDKDTLNELNDICASHGWSDELAVLSAIRQYSLISKLHSSYIVNLPNVVHDKGELKNDLFAPYWPSHLIPWSCHPQYKLDGTQTGRLSAANPAIHNMPSKSAIKRLFRSRWREAGGCHLQFDYGAMEVRILACSFMANDPTLKAAFLQGFDAHKYVASLVFQKPIEQVTAAERKVCKTVNFACLYGSGPQNVAGLLGISLRKAENFIADYLATLSHVAKWKHIQEQNALMQGFVKSAFGRIRYLSTKVYSIGEVERRAVNTPIQSTASDVTLTSYVRIFWGMLKQAYKSLPYLFVHDSLGFDVFPGEFFDLWEFLQHEMADVPPTLYPWLDVPLVVDCDAGYSWGAMAKVQRMDRQNWKILGESENCSALVHQLRLAGHQFSVVESQEVIEEKTSTVLHLSVSR